jgi:hypothetical protein
LTVNVECHLKNVSFEQSKGLTKEIYVKVGYDNCRRLCRKKKATTPKKKKKKKKIVMEELIEADMIEDEIDNVTIWSFDCIWSLLLMSIASSEKPLAVSYLAMMCYKANRLKEKAIDHWLVKKLEDLVSHVLLIKYKDATLIVEVLARGGRPDLAGQIALQHPQRDVAMVCAYISHSAPWGAPFDTVGKWLCTAIDLAGCALSDSRSVRDYIMTLRIFVHTLVDFETLVRIVVANEPLLHVDDWNEVYEIVLLTMCTRLQTVHHEAALVMLRQRWPVAAERICAAAEACIHRRAPRSPVVVVSFLATYGDDQALLLYFKDILDAVQCGDFRVNGSTVDLHSDKDGFDILSPLIVARALYGCHYGSVRIVFGRGNHCNGSGRQRLGNVLRNWLGAAVMYADDNDISIRIDVRKARQLGLFEVQAVMQAIRFALRARRESPGW